MPGCGSKCRPPIGVSICRRERTLHSRVSLSRLVSVVRTLRGVAMATSERRYYTPDEESPIVGRKIDVTEYVVALETDRNWLREAAEVVVREWKADNPFLGYAIEELERRLTTGPEGDADV
jgi:hypothetical protein